MKRKTKKKRYGPDMAKAYLIEKARQKQEFATKAVAFGDVMLNAILLAVHREFGFGADRLQRIINEYQNVLVEFSNDSKRDLQGYGDMKLQREVEKIFKRKMSALDGNPNSGQ